jgi:hypothetical protein
MKPLPYTPLPLTHGARAYTSAEHTDISSMIAQWIEQHSPIEVCAVDRARIGDDYDEVERGGYLELSGEFQP